MKVVMIEHYQDSSHIFAPQQEVTVDDNLGAWLVEHRKAIKVEAAVEQPVPQKETVEAEKLGYGSIPSVSLDFNKFEELAEEETPKQSRKRGKK